MPTKPPSSAPLPPSSAIAEIPEHLRHYIHLTRLAEMGRMASQVGHELNNPLMVAMGFAENIEILLAQETPPPATELDVQIKEIIKACERMAKIISKMQSLGKEQKLRLVNVNLVDIAQNALAVVQTQLSEFDIEVSLQASSPVPIHCDTLQVEQTIANVLTNAIQALRDHTPPRKINLSFGSLNHWSQVTIHNNGPIIPADVQAKLATPFYAASADHSAAGLGLAVARAIMQIHGGELTFKSTEASGTEFCLSFPQPQSATEAEPQPRKGRIFVVDPKPDHRQFLTDKLQLLGFRVESFASTETMWSELHRREPVLAVLVDVVPGLTTSLELVHRIRQEMGPAALIFTLSDGSIASDSRQLLKSQGASEHFQKPVQLENFTFLVKQLDSVPLDAADKKPA